MQKIEILCGQNLARHRWPDPRVSIIPSAHRQPDVETKRYTMAEPYELRRVFIKHSRSMLPGPDRNEYRQIAISTRFLSKDKTWLAVHTVDGPK